jgi:hypothetical protein
VNRSKRQQRPTCLQNFAAVISSSETADRQAIDDLPVGNITDVRDFCIRGQGWLGGPRLPGLVATRRTPGL